MTSPSSWLASVVATQNPYAGQQGMEWYELAWNQGYAYGREHPDEDQPAAPSVFPPLDVDPDYLSYMQQVWSEGDLAARTDGHPNVQHHDEHGSPIEALDYAHTGYDVAKTGWALVRGVATVGEIGASAISVFIMLIGMTEPSNEELAQQDLQIWFQQACNQYNCMEFFLAVSWPSASEATGWYGPQVHNTFEAAEEDARQFVAANPGHEVQVAHYRADSPAMMELIPLEQP